MILNRKLLAFLILSIALPLTLIIVAYVNTYYEFPERIAIGIVGEEPAQQLRFIVEVSEPVRFNLLYGLLVGFLSGMMFAVSLLYQHRRTFPRT